MHRAWASALPGREREAWHKNAVAENANTTIRSIRRLINCSNKAGRSLMKGIPARLSIVNSCQPKND